MLDWQCRPFAELPAADLYAALRLRAEVFVIEQRCVYLDPDGFDPQCWHLLGRGADGALAAYARLVPPGLKGPLPMIGRVVTAPAARGAGQGRELMREALAACARLWPGLVVEISAQAHLERFYAGLGFRTTSAPYDDDGIPHLDMQWTPPA
ncbi:GNAT family N-acetyltransferase [Roseateles sp. DAIF2]|uniref:GNAT family N-acetyltransferase n=1 Tax=Roseateles sp. DAIF2 TaxID=2714952 RepID=UPI0018A2B251|nr:GNAT family N-acetyltransferase [Roseateles sp. DAIF2]QPF74984.1 GNAT family N-acetyltransferase [Roseateles sp. DAIF2]